MDCRNSAFRKKKQMNTAPPIGSGSSLGIELEPDPNRLAMSSRAAGPVYAFVEFLFLCVVPGIGARAYHAIEAPGHTPADGSMLVFGIAMAALYLLLSQPRGSFALDELRSASICWPLACWSLAVMGVAWPSFALRLGERVPLASVMIGFLIGALGLAALRLAVPFAVNLAFHRRLLEGRRAILLSGGSLMPEGVGADALDSAGISVQGRFKLPGYCDEVLPGDLDRLAADVILAARERHADEILVTADAFRLPSFATVIEKLRVLPLRIRLVPSTSAGKGSRMRPQHAHDGALELQAPPLTSGERMLKRCLDVTVATALLLLLSPLLIAIAILIRLDSRGPILFCQKRVGFCGRTFMIYKFRSMTTTEDGPVIRQVERGDARITRVGRILRELSLDELPQLINVVIGDMSLVGPRPHAVAHDRYYESLIPDYAWRHHALPGITGWAQVTGYRGGTPTLACMEERIERDLWYIRNWSIWLDLKILFMTIGTVTRPTNAY
jgi:Undecaprenyl-phosphate glucose phosphotransferase